MLTVLSAFAEEESRSVSENVKWGIRKRFEKGEGIPGEVLRSCRNNLWIRASTGSASGD